MPVLIRSVLTDAQWSMVRTTIRRHITGWHVAPKVDFDEWNLERDVVWNRSACWAELDRSFGLNLGDDVRHQYYTTPKMIGIYIGYLIADPPLSDTVRPAVVSLTRVREVLAAARAQSEPTGAEHFAATVAWAIDEITR